VVWRSSCVSLAARSHVSWFSQSDLVYNMV